EERAEQLVGEGMGPKEAVRQARLAFGNRTLLEERSREVWQWPTLESIWADLRFALRQLRRSPGFAISAVLTLALAIGANAVVFAVFDGLILRPLHVPQSESLYGTPYGDNPGWQSYPNYLDLRDRNHSFESLAAYNIVWTAFDKGKDVDSSTIGFATSGNYFDVLRIQPYLGRFYHAADERGPNSAPYVVLAYKYWHSFFQDDCNVVGRAVLLNRHPYTIIGVAPPDFSGTLAFSQTNFFMPIVNEEQIVGGDLLNARGSTAAVYEIFGHLRPGVTPEQATADVNAVGAYLENTYPKNFGHRTSTISRQGLASYGGKAEAFIGGLMLLSGLILLAACANLGSLFAARTADRSREVALRLALGSSRRRILRQLFTEAVLISLCGAAVGLMGSIVLLRRLSLWRPVSGAPFHLPVTLDAHLYLVALILALISGFLFGMVPARQVLRTNPYGIVKAGASARLGRRITVRDTLLMVQIAICAVLVTASLVAVRGLVRTLHGNFGFEPRNTMLVYTDLAKTGYDPNHAIAMQQRMMDAIESVPGVERVGLVNDYPPLAYDSNLRMNIFKDETVDLRQSNAAAMPFFYGVSTDYFAAAGTSLLTGRSFTRSDDKNAPRVAVINREFATKVFGSVAAAVEGHYKLQDGTHVQVVGIAEDGKYLSLTEEQQPAMFLPNLQSSSSASFIIVRSHRDPHQLATAIRAKLHELDESMWAYYSPWYEIMDTALFPSRVATLALGVLGLMGAVLSITGIFGMAAYSVSKRLREFGIRIALGAKRTEVLQAALGRSLKLLAFGSGAGVLLGILAGRVLALIVYQATPRDPLVLAGVVLAMSLLGLVATWLPAQRALSVNPVNLLREE
ncbi:MAG: ADOP family duplicated permease, partial [Terracidiphilus sp.]